MKFNKSALIAAIDEIEDLAASQNRSGGAVLFEDALRRHYPLLRNTVMRAAKLEAAVRPFPRRDPATPE